MDTPIDNKKVNSIAKINDKFWLGFFLGYITHLFGFIIAIFLKDKRFKKGTLSGAVISLISITIFALLIVIVMINIYKHGFPGPQRP